MTLRQFDPDSFFRRHPIRLRQTQNQCNQSLLHGRKRKFLDDADQAPQARTNHGNHLERYLRMFAAEILEIPPRNEQNFGVFHG
jgi:hypothetical protein